MMDQETKEMLALYRHVRRERGWTREQARTVVAWVFHYNDPEGGIFGWSDKDHP